MHKAWIRTEAILALSHKLSPSGYVYIVIKQCACVCVPEPRLQLKPGHLHCSCIALQPELCKPKSVDMG